MGFLSNLFGSIGNTVSSWFGGGQNQQSQQDQEQKKQQQQNQAAATPATPISQLNGRESTPVPQNTLNLQSLTNQLKPVAPKPQPVVPPPPPTQVHQLTSIQPNPLNNLNRVGTNPMPAYQPFNQQSITNQLHNQPAFTAPQQSNPLGDLAQAAGQLGAGTLYGFDNAARGLAKGVVGGLGVLGVPGTQEAQQRMQAQIDQQQNDINSSGASQLGANIGKLGFATTSGRTALNDVGNGINAAGTSLQPVINNNQTLNNAADYATLSPVGKNVIMPTIAGLASSTLNRTGLQNVSDTQGNAVNNNSTLKAFGIQPFQVAGQLGGDPLNYAPFGEAKGAMSAAKAFSKFGAFGASLDPANNFQDWLGHTIVGGATGAATGPILHGAGKVAGPLLQGVGDAAGSFLRGAGDAAGSALHNVISGASDIVGKGIDSVSHSFNPHTIETAGNDIASVVRDGINPSEVAAGIKSVNPNQVEDAAAPVLKQQAEQAAQKAASTPPQHQTDLEKIIQGGGSKQDVQAYINGLPLNEQQAATESVSKLMGNLPDESKIVPATSTEKAGSAKIAINDNSTIPQQGTNTSPQNNGSPAGVPAEGAIASGQDFRQQLIDGLTHASNQSSSDASSLLGARSQRAAQAISATNGLTGQAATDARLAAMGGAMNHRGTYTGIGGDDASSIFDGLRLQAQAIPELATNPHSLTNVETALSRAIQGTDLKGNVVGAPTASEIGLLKKYFGPEVSDAVQQSVSDSQTMGQKAMAMAGEIASIPKALMASYDISGTLRQGGVLATRFPGLAAHAAVEQIKYLANPEYFKSAMQAIEDSPRYTQAAQSGLALTGVQSLDKSEEQFVGKLVGNIPGIAASERAYTGFLTKFRMDTFNQIMDKAESGGDTLSQKDVASVSNFINTASGRGDLGNFFENHANTLTTALFSPRLWASRLQMLNPMYYAGLSGPARTYALQSAGTFAGTAATVLGMAKLAGAEVSTDPRSSDFLKIKYGNNRYDILGGFQQNLVFAARELTGESVSSTTGAVNKFAPGITDIGNQNGLLATSKFGGLDRVKLLSDLVDNKANPIIAAGAHILSGKGMGGKPVDVLGELGNMVTPLNVSGAISAAQDQGNLSMSDPIGSAKTLAKGALLNSPDLIGVSAQNYGTVPTKYQSASQANNPIPVPPDVQKVLDKQKTEAQAADFKSRGVPFYTDKGFDKAVQARTEQGQFDKAIEGLQSKYDSSSKNPDIPASDLADQKDAITRLNVAKTNNIDPKIIGQYVGAGKDGVSLKEWRNLGDPNSDTYNPKLYQDLYSYDSALAKDGVSKNSVSGDKNFYFAKAPAKGRSGGARLANNNLLGATPNLGKISFGNLSSKAIGVAPVPAVTRLASANLVPRHQISVTKVQ